MAPCAKPLCLQVDLSRYTISNYMRIVTYKTAFYSFYLPVACGLIVGGVQDPAAFDSARTILLDMGQYFQVAAPANKCTTHT